jgi:hypothetical protein
VASPKQRTKPLAKSKGHPSSSDPAPCAHGGAPNDLPSRALRLPLESCMDILSQMATELALGPEEMLSLTHRKFEAEWDGVRRTLDHPRWSRDLSVIQVMRILDVEQHKRDGDRRYGDDPLLLAKFHEFYLEPKWIARLDEEVAKILRARGDQVVAEDRVRAAETARHLVYRSLKHAWTESAPSTSGNTLAATDALAAELAANLARRLETWGDMFDSIVTELPPGWASAANLDAARVVIRDVLCKVKRPITMNSMIDASELAIKAALREFGYPEPRVRSLFEAPALDAKRESYHRI